MFKEFITDFISNQSIFRSKEEIIARMSSPAGSQIDTDLLLLLMANAALIAALAILHFIKPKKFTSISEYTSHRTFVSKCKTICYISIYTSYFVLGKDMILNPSYNIITFVLYAIVSISALLYAFHREKVILFSKIN